MSYCGYNDTRQNALFGRYLNNRRIGKVATKPHTLGLLGHSGVWLHSSFWGFHPHFRGRSCAVVLDHKCFHDIIAEIWWLIKSCEVCILHISSAAIMMIWISALVRDLLVRNSPMPSEEIRRQRGLSIALLVPWLLRLKSELASPGLAQICL